VDESKLTTDVGEEATDEKPPTEPVVTARLVDPDPQAIPITFPVESVVVHWPGVMNGSRIWFENVPLETEKA